jgi:hypothetical protein
MAWDCRRCQLVWDTLRQAKLESMRLNDHLFHFTYLKGNKISANLKSELIIEKTIEWLEKAVIGLNLCPFAKAVHVKKQIRFVVSDAPDEKSLIAELVNELQFLANHGADEVDTTLLIHPACLNDFLEYNGFLELADQILDEQGFCGEFQIASFHPDYQFADSPGDAIENFTNRSPFPMLHLLRESSIAKAVDAFPDAEQIYGKNIETMRTIGHHGYLALFGQSPAPQG